VEFGKVFDKSWGEYRENFREIFLAMLIFLIIPSLVWSVVNTSYILSDSVLRESFLRHSSEFGVFSPGYFGIQFLIGVVSLLLIIFMSAGLIGISLKKKNYSFGEIVGEGKEHFWRYLGFGIVVSVFIGLLFLLFIVPGVIFAIFWIFSAYIFIGKKKGILDSLRESWRIVRGRWWRVLGYGLLFGLIILGIAILFGIFRIIITLPLIIGQGISGLAGAAPISATHFVTISIIASLVDSLSQTVILPLSLLFYKNFYLAMKKKR